MTWMNDIHAYITPSNDMHEGYTYIYNTLSDMDE